MPLEERLDTSGLDFDSPLVGREGLQEVLPHRGAMLLVDGIVSMEIDPPRGRIVGFRDVGPDEFWTAGHFPGNPIVPGVVIVEAAAQACLYLWKQVVPAVRDRFIVFGGIENVRFRGMVRPGDRLVLVGEGANLGRRLCRISTQGWVADRLVYDGEILAIAT